MNLSTRAYAYIAATAAATASVVVLFYLQSPPVPLSTNLLQAIAIFGILLFFLEIYEVELVYKRTLSTGMAICLATIILGGGYIAIPVTMLATLAAELIISWDYWERGLGDYVAVVTFNVTQFTLATLAALGAFHLAGGEPLLLSSLTQADLIFANHLLPAIAAFLTFEFANNLLVAGIITITQRTHFTYHLRFDLKHLSIQFIALGAISLALPLVYVQSPWNLIPVIIPLGLVYASLRSYMHLRRQAKETFETIANMLSTRDPYTFDHSQDAAELAVDIARHLSLSEDRIDVVQSAAVIHDIGKIGIPDEILKKPGPLNEAEWIEMKRHPDIGADLIKDLEMYQEVAEIVRCEHEKWDGSGYPKGLRGEEIPIEARIVTVADIYDALTTDRPYRKAFAHERAIEIIKEMRDDRKLDPRVVDAFLQLAEHDPQRNSSAH